VTRGFAAEADMLGPIAAAVQSLAGRDAVALFETPSAAGVPDVVAAVFDQAAIGSRADGSFVTDQVGWLLCWHCRTRSCPDVRWRRIR
jgi:hypothetical protein